MWFSCEADARIAALANQITTMDFPMSTREAFALLYANQSNFGIKSKEYEGSTEVGTMAAASC